MGRHLAASLNVSKCLDEKMINVNILMFNF